MSAEWEDPNWAEKWYRIICEKVRNEQEQLLLRPINLTQIEIELDENENSGDD